LREAALPLVVFLVLVVGAAAQESDQMSVPRFYPLGPPVHVKVLEKKGAVEDGALEYGYLVWKGQAIASCVLTVGNVTRLVPTVTAVNADGTVEFKVDGREVTGFFYETGGYFGVELDAAVVKRVKPGEWEFLYLTREGVEKAVFELPAGYDLELRPVPVGRDEVAAFFGGPHGDLVAVLDERDGRVTVVKGLVFKGWTRSFEYPVVVFDGEVFVLCTRYYTFPTAPVPVVAFELPEGWSVRAVAESEDVVALVLWDGKEFKAVAYNLSMGSWGAVKSLGEKNGAYEFLIWGVGGTYLLKYNPPGEATLSMTFPNGTLVGKPVKLKVLHPVLADPSFHGGVVTDFMHPRFHLEKLGKVEADAGYGLTGGTLYRVTAPGIDLYAVVVSGHLLVVPSRFFLIGFREGVPEIRGERIATVTLKAEDGAASVEIRYPFLGTLRMDGCLVIGDIPLPGSGPTDALEAVLHAKTPMLAFPVPVEFTWEKKAWYAVTWRKKLIRLDGEPKDVVYLGNGKVAVVVISPKGWIMDVIDLNSGRMIEREPVVEGGECLITPDGIVAVPNTPIAMHVAVAVVRSKRSGGPRAPERRKPHGSHGLPAVPVPIPVRRRDRSSPPPPFLPVPPRYDRDRYLPPVNVHQEGTPRLDPRGTDGARADDGDRGRIRDRRVLLPPRPRRRRQGTGLRLPEGRHPLPRPRVPRHRRPLLHGHRDLRGLRDLRRRDLPRTDRGRRERGRHRRSRDRREGGDRVLRERR